AQRAADLRRGDSGRHQALCGAQQHQVLKGKPQLPSHGACGGEETSAGVGSDLGGREAEEPRDFLGGIARHRLRAGGPSFLGRLDLDGALGALRGFALAASRALALGETRLERLHQVDNLRDRKSTRLNSSHERSSYAVFCLKKKRPRTSGQRVPKRFGQRRARERGTGQRPRRPHSMTRRGTTPMTNKLPSLAPTTATERTSE